MNSVKVKVKGQLINLPSMHNNSGHSKSGNWNEYNLNPFTRINWRACLVPIIVPKNINLSAISDAYQTIAIVCEAPGK
jgi:hypothetical protein